MLNVSASHDFDPGRAAFRSGSIFPCIGTGSGRTGQPHHQVTGLIDRPNMGGRKQERQRLSSRPGFPAVRMGTTFAPVAACAAKRLPPWQKIRPAVRLSQDRTLVASQRIGRRIAGQVNHESLSGRAYADALARQIAAPTPAAWRNRPAPLRSRYEP